MKERLVAKSLVILIGLVFLGGVLYAGTVAKDVIHMQNPAYKKHTRGIVAFSHKKHAEGYTANKCGECHHDENNKPLENLKAGDAVKSCIECHSLPGFVIGKDARGKDDKTLRQNHANAMHDNCRGCHVKHNKDKNLKPKDAGAAPIQCNECHPGKG